MGLVSEVDAGTINEGGAQITRNISIQIHLDWLLHLHVLRQLHIISHRSGIVFITQLHNFFT